MKNKPKKIIWTHVDSNGVSILLGDNVEYLHSAKYQDNYTVTEIGRKKITITNPQTGKILRLTPDKMEVI